MPTKKKRVGFIPRDDVLKIIDQLSIENNLSNSKIISILVEEALSVRGIFNKKNGKISQLYQEFNELSEFSSKDFTDHKGSDEFIINTKFINKNPVKPTFSKSSSRESFDFITYKKFLSFLKFQEIMDEYNT